MTIVRFRDCLRRNGSDMDASIQVIILLSLVIECPAAIEKVALVARVSERYSEASLGQGGNILEVGINFREPEAAAEAAISNEQETSVPLGRQPQFEGHLIRPGMQGSHVAQHVAVCNRIGLRRRGYNRGIRARNRLNGGWGAVHGS